MWDCPVRKSARLHVCGHQVGGTSASSSTLSRTWKMSLAIQTLTKAWNPVVSAPCSCRCVAVVQNHNPQLDHSLWWIQTVGGYFPNHTLFVIPGFDLCIGIVGEAIILFYSWSLSCLHMFTLFLHIFAPYSVCTYTYPYTYICMYIVLHYFCTYVDAYNIPMPSRRRPPASWCCPYGELPPALHPSVQ